MSIQKKSLISALKTTKKANVASTEVSKGEKMTSMKRGVQMVQPRAISVTSTKTVSAKRSFNLKKMA